MATNINQRIYNKLEQLTGGLDKFLKHTRYLKLKSKGFMDLSIEKVGEGVIALSHYYEQNGDLVPDPDMMVQINLNTKTAEALSYQDIYRYNEVYEDYRTKEKYNPKLKKSLNTFLNQWLTVLKKQGFHQ